MTDEKRIATFEWLYNNLYIFKKGTPPNSKKGVTKNELITNYSVNESLLSSYTSNQLIPRGKCVGVNLNIPTAFGDVSVETTNIKRVAGYIEFNRLKEAENYFNLAANVLLVNKSNVLIKPINKNINLGNTTGIGYMNVILDEIKAMTNIDNITGWELYIKITTTKDMIYDAERLKVPPSVLGTYVNLNDVYGMDLNFHYIVYVTNDYSPNYPNSGDIISHYNYLDIHTNGLSIYMKPDDPYDVVGFNTYGVAFDTLHNTDYFSFGKRQVKGSSGAYTSAPNGTPNFPRPTGINGAFDCEWFQDYNEIIIEVKGVKGSTSMDLGKFTFIYNTIEA